MSRCLLAIAVLATSWACLVQYVQCTKPCQERCRWSYPTSSWAWFREGEYQSCWVACEAACFEGKKRCEGAKI